MYVPPLNQTLNLLPRRPHPSLRYFQRSECSHNARNCTLNISHIDSSKVLKPKCLCFTKIDIPSLRVSSNTFPNTSPIEPIQDTIQIFHHRSPMVHDSHSPC